MSIEASLAGIGDFLERNDALIKNLRDAGSEAAATLRTLAERVAAHREATAELMAKIDRIPFVTAKDEIVRGRQARLLREIEETRRKIHAFRDDPTLMGLFETNLSAFYQELGNTTIAESVARMVTFSQEEVDELRVLLRRATLDAESRQRKADLLDAAAQLGKLGLKVGIKLVA